MDAAIRPSWWHALVVALCTACLICAACSVQPRLGEAPGAAAFGNDRGKDSVAPAAVVRGRPVSKAALHDFWFERYPEAYAQTIEAFVDQRLVIEEAHRHGVRVPRKALEASLTAEVKARQEQLRALYGDAADLDAEVRRAYGMDRATWKRTVLTPRMHTRLLMERVIRWDTRRRDQVHARVIVLADERKARTVMQSLRDGADFSLTAASVSIDPSRKRGGDLPRIGRGDLADRDLENRLFAAPAGSLVGPLSLRLGGANQWHVYKVIRRVASWKGNLESQWQRLEDDLLAHKVSQGEYERWQARMHRDAGVKLYRPDGRLWQRPAPR